MHRKFSTLPIFLGVAAAFSCAIATEAATPVATYEFKSNFNSDEGAPSLVATDPESASQFVTDTALGQSRTVWAFAGANSPAAQQAGLTVNTTGLISPHTYSVDFVAKFNERTGAWRRLIDVQNRQSDAGFYVDPSNNLDVYPTSGASASWSNGVYHHVVVTTDGTTVNAYLDGVSQFTSTTNLLNLDYDPTNNPGRLMGFFLDNVSGGGQGEWSSGSVALIRLWDGVLTPAEAQALASNPFASTAVSVAITSPPNGARLIAGDSVSIVANPSVAEGDISSVQFYVDDALVGGVDAPNPYVYALMVPPVGPHTISAVAITNDGSQAKQSISFTSIPVDPASPAPSVSILTAADGRALAASSTFMLSASAFANTAGEELQEVDFYADGVIFASFDGTGAPLPRENGRPVRQEDALANGSVFSAPFQMPGVSKLVNLIAVALTKANAAHVSLPVTVQSVANAADHPPTVKISGLANGAKVAKSAVATDIQVDISDPDAVQSSGIRERPLARAFDVSPVIARVQYYLNSLLVKDSKEAPFTLPFLPASSGTYVLSAVATDGAGLAAISDPVQVEVVSPSTVTIAVKGSSVLTEAGMKGKAEVTRDGDLGADLVVQLKLKGSAVNGVDYQEVPTTVTIPAGLPSAKVKIKPINDLINKGTRSIKIQVVADPAGAYQPGPGGKAKFTLLDDDF